MFREIRWSQGESDATMAPHHEDGLGLYAQALIKPALRLQALHHVGSLFAHGLTHHEADRLHIENEKAFQ
jgi:hypothetical protein